MMAEPTEPPKKPMDEVIREDGRYPGEAFDFLHDGMSRAVKEAHGEEAIGPGKEAADSHVTGSELCLSLRDQALERWGMLAKTVLNHWNIHGTIDFGNMVYLLIQHRFMRKTETDSIEHFRDVYDFDDAFDGEDDFELSE